MYISLMGKILNSPKGVKSCVLERVIIFAAHVAPATSLCTQTDDPITNDRCIHRCSYSRGHLPGNGMVRYTLFKSTGYNLILYVCPRDVNKLWRVSTSYNYLLYQLHFYKWLWQDHILGHVPWIATCSYILATMAWCIFCVYHFASAGVNMHTYIITTQEEMEFGKVFYAPVLTLSNVQCIRAIRYAQYL